jgi:hypothetical protein
VNLAEIDISLTIFMRNSLTNPLFYVKLFTMYMEMQAHSLKQGEIGALLFWINPPALP